MRDGISNYVEHYKKIKKIRDDLLYYLSESEVEKIAEGYYDDI